VQCNGTCCIASAYVHPSFPLLATPHATVSCTSNSNESVNMQFMSYSTMQMCTERTHIQRPHVHALHCLHHARSSSVIHQSLCLSSFFGSQKICNFSRQHADDSTRDQADSLHRYESQVSSSRMEHQKPRKKMSQKAR
jgi:hypothetical protein